MKAEGVIEALNAHIEHIRLAKNIKCDSHFIVHTTIEEPTSFNSSIKTIKHNVVLIDKENTYPILGATVNARVSIYEDINIYIEQANILLTRQVFILLSNTSLIESIIKGECGRNNTN